MPLGGIVFVMDSRRDRILSLFAMNSISRAREVLSGGRSRSLYVGATSGWCMRGCPGPAGGTRSAVPPPPISSRRRAAIESPRSPVAPPRPSPPGRKYQSLSEKKHQGRLRLFSRGATRHPSWHLSTSNWIGKDVRRPGCQEHRSGCVSAQIALPSRHKESCRL